MNSERPVVLVVDRESEATRALIAFLRSRGLEVVWARDGESAFTALDQTPVDGLVTELHVQRIDGMSLVRRARARHPEVCAIVITERPGIEKAVEAMRQGAADFQVKPLNHEKLLAVLKHGLERQALVARVAEMEAQLDQRFGFAALHGRRAGAVRAGRRRHPLPRRRGAASGRGPGAAAAPPAPSLVR